MSSPTARLKQAKDQITATIERRVDALAEGEVDEHAVADLLGTLGALREVVRQIAGADADITEYERRKDRLRTGLAKASANARGDTNRLRERMDELQSTIDELVATRDRLTDHLATLTSRLRAG